MPGRTNRDLASDDLWQRSLERSRRRRVLAEAARKDQARRKTASVAVSAAVATAPMWPSITAGASGLSKDDVGKLAKKLRNDGGDRVLLAYGDASSAVAEAQRALGILEDGIFGPQTRAAVRAFQKRMDLPATGKIDVRTWLKLFPTDAIVYAPAGSASALGAGNAGGSQWAAVSTIGDGGEGRPGRADAATAWTKKREGRDAPKVRAATVGLPGLLADTEVPNGGGLDLGAVGQPPTGVPGLPLVGGPPPNGGQPAPGGGVGAPPSYFPVPSPGGTAEGMIAAMIAAANRIDRARYPYRWGGGHNMRFSGPYDCSGAVSAVLRAAGLLKSPMVSGQFMRWGRPGRGLVTIYANAGHVYMSIRGRYFGTSRANPGGGAGWFRGGPRSGFAVVHVPFELMHTSNKRKQKRRAQRYIRKRMRFKPAPVAPRKETVTGGAQAGTPTQAPSPPAQPQGPVTAPAPSVQPTIPSVPVPSVPQVQVPSVPPAVTTPTVGPGSPGPSQGGAQTQVTPPTTLPAPVQAPAGSGGQGGSSGSQGSNGVAPAGGSSGATYKPVAAPAPSAPQGAPAVGGANGVANRLGDAVGEVTDKVSSVAPSPQPSGQGGGETPPSSGASSGSTG